MPDNLWSKTYTEADEWQTAATYRPFVRAINERIRSVDPTFATFDEWPENLAGEDALQITAGWAKMQAVVTALADLYCDPATDPAGEHVDGYSRPLLSDRAAWPGVSGWTRKREREITSIAASGTDGQRARYIWTISVSPSGEIANGTKIFDRIAGVWVLSADQATTPDIVTSYGLIQAGDLFGPWIVNELCDAINDLWITPLAPYVYQQVVQSNDAPTYPVNGAGFHIHTEYSASNSDPDLIAALAAGTDTVSDNAEADLPTTGTWVVDGTAGVRYSWFVSGSNNEPRTFTCYAHITNVKSKPAVADVPDHCLSTVDWYFAAKKPAPINGSYTPTWHDGGTGLTENLFSKVGETSSAAAVAGEIQGPEVGDLTVIPARPPAMTNTGWNSEGKVHGYDDNGITPLAYARWNVSGGFEYGAPSP